MLMRWHGARLDGERAPLATTQGLWERAHALGEQRHVGVYNVPATCGAVAMRRWTRAGCVRVRIWRGF